MKMHVNLQAQDLWNTIKYGNGVEESKDRMNFSVIYQAVLEDVLLMFVEKDSTKIVWEMLQTMCLGVDRVKEVKV